MGRKKKSRKQDARLATIVLLTAILNLIKAIADVVSRLIE